MFDDFEMQKGMIKIVKTIHEFMSQSVNSRSRCLEMMTNANNADRLFCLKLSDQIRTLSPRVTSMVSKVLGLLILNILPTCN